MMTMPVQKPGRSKQDYCTPPVFVEESAALLGFPRFNWDLAASKENSVGVYHYSEQEDSLTQDWNALEGAAWLNPPYADITPWVEKAAATLTMTIAMLVPASVGANWWRDHVHDQAVVSFINGRLTFVGQSAPYPKDCALLVYNHPVCSPGYYVWDWRNREVS